MSDELRDRIARVLAPEDWRLRDNGSLPIDHPGAIAVVRGSREQAQAVINDLGMTVHEVDRGNATKYATKWLHP